MDFLWHVYSACGIFYFGLLVFSFLGVLAFNLGALFLSRTRTIFWFALAAALLPVAIGLLGTLEGYAVVARTERYVQVSPEESEAAYATARVSGYVGAALATPLLLLAILGLAVKGKAGPRRPTLP